MPERTCSVDGCPKAHRARGYCSTHYNQHCVPAGQRHAKTTVPCDWCGRPCVKDRTRARRYAGLFCSLSCRDSWRAMRLGANLCPVPERHPAHPRWADRLLPVVWVPPQPNPRARTRWVAGYCHRCGKAYVAEDYTDTARYCSVACARRVAKHRYRARRRKAYVADVSPRRIYERDGWRCKLCRKPVRRDLVAPEPLAPVLDHVVPLAQGGTHEPANVQCAHFLCNSIKRDQLAAVQQLALY